MSWDQLRTQIEKHLDLEELRTLCFDLSIDYDSLRGEGKAAKIRELIALLRRTNRIPQLLAALGVIRPNVQWSAIQLVDANTPSAPRRSRSLWLIGVGVVVLVALAGLVLSNGPNSIAFFSSTPTSPPPPPTEQPTGAQTVTRPTDGVESPTDTLPTAAPTVDIPTPAPPTPTPEPPHAPPIENTFGTELYDEQVILLSIPSGGNKVLKVMDLWSAPLGTPVSCATGFLTFTWMVRDPYPAGGSDLEVRQLIPMGDGRTDILAQGASGAATTGWCQELTFVNNSLVDYRVELRYASGSHG